MSYCWLPESRVPATAAPAATPTDADGDCEGDPDAVADMLALADTGDREGVPERLRVRVGVAVRDDERDRVLLCVGRGLGVAEPGGTVTEALVLREGEALALELAEAVTDAVGGPERLGDCDGVKPCVCDVPKLVLMLWLEDALGCWEPEVDGVRDELRVAEGEGDAVADRVPADEPVWLALRDCDVDCDGEAL